MQHVPLAQVRHQIEAGQPLPFNVLRPDATLLLARGQVLQSAAQLDALLERGSLVDLRELQAAQPCKPWPADLATLPREALPALWAASTTHLDQVLRRPEPRSFRAALDEAADGFSALIDHDPDLAIFQVLRQDNAPHTRYGVMHAVHTAIVAHLVARRLGWPDEDTRRAFRAALTMNVSILELQGEMAAQAHPPTDAQRRQLADHPQRSHDLLVQAGISDPVWLQAVAEHHEERGGRGYPRGLKEPCELATLLRRADVYTARLSARASREAQAADQAGREIFMQDPGHPICAALVKEFGVYPPGCFVSLACGETGVVIARGPSVMTPVVASMTNAFGNPLPAPVRRDTREPLYAIAGVLQPRQMRARLSPEKLAALAG